MNIKTKLYAGLGILAFLIVVLGGSGLVFINMLAENSSAIIRNNIRTLTYMESMEQTLKELHLKLASELDSVKVSQSESLSIAVDSLKKQLINSLSNQLQNIKETGEAEISDRLQEAIMEYVDRYEQRNTQSNSDLVSYQELAIQYGQIQGMLAEITNLNIEAIERKNDVAQKTAPNVIFYMTIIGVISTLLAFGLLIKYPNYIVKPIGELIDRIKQIADQNYDQRLEFTTGDEYEELAQAFNRMATRLQEYDSSTMAKLMNEKQRIEVIINHMYEAVIGLDRERNVLFVNAMAEELIGRDRSSLVGRYAPDIASTNDLVRKLIQDLMEGSRDEEDNDEPDLVKIMNGDRQVFYSKETIPVITDNAAADEEKQIGTIITLKNVTHFQEMDEAKSNFVAVVSHELKTPIASINMSLRLLEDERVGKLNEEQSNLIQSIRDDTQRMKRTTTELLDLSKIEAGNIQLNPQPARPLDLIEYAYETMIMQANQKDISLEIDCDQNLPPVKTDVQKTVWVLVNLISNAIRYTPAAGRIELKASEKSGSIEFLVTDTGEGIVEEYLDKIFQKYFQVYSEKDRDGGSGLGLAIAKEFINAQGGEIDVQSTVGKGSTFFFTLPKN